MCRAERQIFVISLSRRAASGRVRLGPFDMPAALGRSGRSARKREGDGATPIGRWRLLEVYYRPDRVARPATRLPVSRITRAVGWCDAAGDRNYNRQVRLPYPASHERLCREDHLYDLVVVLDHNQRPRIRGNGSAIFLHCSRPGLAPTEGCIALPRTLLQRLLRHVRKGDLLIVG